MDLDYFNIISEFKKLQHQMCCLSTTISGLSIGGSGSGGSGISGTYATYAALVAATKVSGSLYIVTADENNGSQMVLYFYDGSQLKSIMTS